MMRPHWRKNGWRSLLRWFHPVVLISLGLHGLFLLIPIASSNLEEEPETAIVSSLSNPSDPGAATVAPVESATPSRSNITEANATVPETLATSVASPGPAVSPSPVPSRTPITALSQMQPASSSSASPETHPPAARPFDSDRTSRSAPDATVTPPLFPLFNRRLTEAPEALRNYVISLRQAYRLNPVAVMPKQALKTWIQQVPEENVTAPLAQQSLRIDYPLQVCLPEAPKAAWIGVLLGSSGEIVEGPQLIRGTGYKGLNTMAIAAIEQQDFSEVDGLSTHVLEVQVDYDRNTCFPPPQTRSP